MSECELCAQVGDDPQLFPPMFGMWLFHLLRAELGAAEEIANQALRFAQRCQEPSLLVTAHIAAGVTCFHRGQLLEAMNHLQQGLATDDDSDYRASVFLYDSDLRGACLNYRAWTLWHLGYPSQALENSQQSLARAQRRFHRFTHSFALDIAAGLHQFRREGSAVQEMAEAEMKLAREHEFPFWLAQGTIYRGWARVQEEQRDEGIEQMEQGVEMAHALHSTLDLPHYLWLLAEGYGSQGKFDMGLTTLEEALLLVIRTEERYWEAEIHRLKGEFLLASVAVDSRREGQQPEEREVQAEACFQTARQIARRQQAKSLELRATTKSNHRTLAQCHTS